jgi:hypothetical protein
MPISFLYFITPFPNFLAPLPIAPNMLLNRLTAMDSFFVAFVPAAAALGGVAFFTVVDCFCGEMSDLVFSVFGSGVLFSSAGLFCDSSEEESTGIIASSGRKLM